MISSFGTPDRPDRRAPVHLTAAPSPPPTVL